MENKEVALITGASRGLGKAIAIELAKEGYVIIINCKERVGDASKTKEEIESFGGEADILIDDITIKGKCKELIIQIQKKYGRIENPTLENG